MWGGDSTDANFIEIMFAKPVASKITFYYDLKDTFDIDFTHKYG